MNFASRKYEYSVSASGYETQSLAGVITKNYTAPNVIKCNVNINSLGEMVLYTKVSLQNDTFLGGLVDKKYNKVLDGGTSAGPVWRIVEGQRLTDVFGNLLEYKYRCVMVVPTIAQITTDPITQFENGAFWTGGNENPNDVRYTKNKYADLL